MLMANQWDHELDQEFNRYIEQANKEYLLYHYYGFHSKEEYEEYLALQREGHPPSDEKENNSHPEDDEPDWEWLNDIARGR